MPSAKGSDSAPATTTSTSGSLARHASANDSDGSAPRTFVLPSRSSRAAVSAADIQCPHARLDSRESDRRGGELRTVAADEKVVGAGRGAEGLSTRHGVRWDGRTRARPEPASR